MENSSLDTVVLRLKSLGIDNLFTFSYISPPEKQGIQASIETLKIV
jgi:HrpA-like RNA helicase